jgi:hypothetical protein
MFEDSDLVHSYSRAQAIADGVLHDVSNVAKDAGFRIPVAMSTGLWAACVAWTEADTERTGVPQDESGRLWDVLWMAGHAARVHRDHPGPRVNFKLMCVPRDGGRRALMRELSIHVGPGDCGEPVITLMLPDED